MAEIVPSIELVEGLAEDEACEPGFDEHAVLARASCLLCFKFRLFLVLHLLARRRLVDYVALIADVSGRLA